MSDVDCVAEYAARLVQSGVPEDEAVEIAFRKCGSPVSRLSAIESEIKAAAETGKQLVSPYLWMLSLTSFVLAIMNTKRISRMYASWKRSR